MINKKLNLTIKEAISLSKFKFELESESDTSIEFSYKNSFVRVIIPEPFEIDLQIRFPETSKKYYSIGGIMKALNVKGDSILNEQEKAVVKNRDNQFDEYCEITVRIYKNIIDKFYDNILNNYEMWIPIYESNEEAEKTKMAELLKKVWSLDIHDPIYIKFKNNNTEWIGDLRKRLNDN